MSAALAGRLKQLADRMDQLAVRERALIFIAVLVVLFVVATNLLFAPLLSEQERVRNDLAGKREQMQKLEAQLQVIIAGASKDLDVDNRAKLAALQEQLGTIDATLAEKTAGLVSPQEMARLVEEILKQNRRLELIKIESLPPSPLGDQANQAQAKPASAEQGAYMIYRHGMRIEFKGRYTDIVDYLKALEALPWKVFWGEAALEAEGYPLSKFSLVLYTLSLREGWIGV